MDNEEVQVFKIENRCGYAAICRNHLTEGQTEFEALDRLEKALKRTERKVVQGK